MDKIVLRKSEVDGRQAAEPTAGPPGAGKLVLSRTEVAGTSARNSEAAQLKDHRPAVVVRESEVADAALHGSRPFQNPQMAAAISPASQALPVGTRVFLWVLTPLLPLLCLAALMVRLVLRDVPAWTRLAWLGHLNSRLVVGGLLWGILALVIGVWPRSAASVGRPAPQTVQPVPGSPTHPAEVPAPPHMGSSQVAGLLTKEELFARFEPLTVIVRAGNSLGAGVILETTGRGNLIGTARHVVGPMDGSGKALLGRSVHAESKDHALAGARIVGVHRTLDLALLWVGDELVPTEVCVPIRRVATLKVGEDIQAIGHPLDVNSFSFSLAPGTISREVGNNGLIHVTAPLWHGFSGGPLLDMRGNLVAISSGIMAKSNAAGVEVPVPGLSLATTAEPFLQANEWYLDQIGSKWLTEFAAKSPAAAITDRPGGQNDKTPTGTPAH
jgi:S1-C subfamily serine protease